MTNEPTVAEMKPEAMHEKVATEAGDGNPTAAVETAAANNTNGSAASVSGTLEQEKKQGEEEEAATAAPPSDAAVIETLRAELAAAEAKADELLDKLQRTAADFQNSRRRQEKQLADEIERASGHLAQRLLPVVDDLDLAFGNLPSELEETQGAWIDGFRQIRKKLESLLEDQGVTTIAQDGEFDPSRHEAISSEPSETVESNHIIQTLRTGYIHKGRVLRPALVRVAM